MLELRAGDFDRLFQTEPVQAWLASFRAARRKALARFWLRLGVGVAAIAALALVYPADWGNPNNWTGLAIFLFPILLILVGMFAYAALRNAGVALKQPVMEAIARHGGVDYRPEGFDSPLGADGTRWLFGPWSFSLQSYSDLLYGHDSDGRGFAIFEALLVRGVGRAAHTAFQGQIFTFERAAGDAQTVIRSNRKIVSDIRPVDDLPRVRIDEDPEFDRTFEVRSTDPVEAKRLLARTALGRLLVERRRTGRIDVYVGPHIAALALGQKDRFEVGSLLGSLNERDRVRRMFDDSAAAGALLREFKAAVG